MKALVMQRLVDWGYPLHLLDIWFAEVQHSCRHALLAQPSGRKQDNSPAPVLMLTNGQFEMTARFSAVVNRVFALYRQDPSVADIFGGPAGRVLVAYCKNTSSGAKLFRARL
jgi:hypothetical protein